MTTDDAIQSNQEPDSAVVKTESRVRMGPKVGPKKFSKEPDAQRIVKTANVGSAKDQELNVGDKAAVPSLKRNATEGGKLRYQMQLQPKILSAYGPLMRDNQGMPKKVTIIKPNHSKKILST